MFKEYNVSHRSHYYLTGFLYLTLLLKDRLKTLAILVQSPMQSLSENTLSLQESCSGPTLFVHGKMFYLVDVELPTGVTKRSRFRSLGQALVM